jgi:glycosyltransferase involved in cell wall biosynthesis
MTDGSHYHSDEEFIRPVRNTPTNSDIVILVTIFLGIPQTQYSSLQDSNLRFELTLAALKELQSEKLGYRLFVAFTGNAQEAQKMIFSANLDESDAHWFEQDSSLLVYGKGRLEHALLMRSIQHWELQINNPWIFKLTAKYKIVNLKDTLEFIRSRTSTVCAWKHIFGKIVDTRAVAFRARAYLHAQNLLDRIDDRRNYFMEHAVHDWVKSVSGTSPLLVHRPLLSGISGSTGVQSSPSLLKRSLVKVATSLWKIKASIFSSPNFSNPTFYFVLGALKVSGGVLEALRLAKELHDAGERVCIIVMWRSTCEVENANQLPIIRLTNWTTLRLLAPIQLPIIFCKFWWRVRGLRRFGNRSNWIFTHYSTLPLGLIVDRQSRWVYLQGAEWDFVRYPVVSRLFKFVVLFFYRRSRLLVASHFLTNALQAFGLRSSGVALVWADPAYLRPVNVPRDIDFVVMLRKGQPKRLDLYLACMTEISRIAPNLKIAVITPDSELADLVASFASVSLIGPSLKIMADLYSRSKIFLLLSESEGFGLPPLEAMGAGCVPVCRDAGGPQSYMLDSLGDLLLPLSMSIQDICLKLLVILNDPVALQNYSDTSRRIFQQGETRALNRAETVRLLMVDNGISEK